MALPAYTLRSKLNTLNYLLSQVEVVTQPGPPDAGGQQENIISSLMILWYTNYQKDHAVSILNTPGENLAFTENLPILSATKFTGFAINCVNKCRGRVETQEGCDLIRAKAPGLIVYLKRRLPNNVDVANLSPTQVFIVFADWINQTVGAVIEIS